MTKLYNIQQRKRQLINTDPQRRCYNGAHASYEIVWGPWETTCWNVKEEDLEDRLEWWRDLNKIATDARGQGAKAEFRGVPQEA